MTTRTRRGRLGGPSVVTAALAAGVVSGLNVVRRYHDDLSEARARIDALHPRTLPTRFGSIQYAETGDPEGRPLLLLHDIGGGVDQGVDAALRLLPSGLRVVVPSRFGYLGSDLPDGAAPSDQAEACADLLDALGIESAAVVAVGAGAVAALELARRHRERVGRLALVSGILPGDAAVPVAGHRLVGRALHSDPLAWGLVTFAPPAVRMAAGVHRADIVTAEDRADLDAFGRSLLVMSRRADGVVFDLFVTLPSAATVPLEDVAVPTLLVTADDDPVARRDAAVRAVERLPDARIVTFARGGHELLGCPVAEAVASFLQAEAVMPA